MVLILYIDDRYTCIIRVQFFASIAKKYFFGKFNILTVYNIYNYMTLVNYGKLIFQQKPTFLCEILNIDVSKDLDNSKNPENSYAYLPKLNTNHK